MKLTICMTYFRSLALANLRAALHSVRMQDLSSVESLVVLDNNTTDPLPAIIAAVDEVGFPLTTPARLVSHKHGDATRTHSWSSNAVLRHAQTEWVLFTRADYLLDFDLLRRFLAVINLKPVDWRGFVTANVYHLNADIGRCELTPWRAAGPRMLRGLPGAEADYTDIDAGVWMARKADVDLVGGLEEGLTAWGHAQTHFQHKLHVSGVEFVRIPEPLFYHPQHGGDRDIAVAHEQARDLGLSLRAMWARYRGPQPYGKDA